MNTYSLTRSIPLSELWDVIVVGGGPSGCTAAISAAREGAKTLLVEASGALGGCGTIALVPAWCPFSDKEKIIYRGLAQKVFDACKAGMPHVRPEDVDWVPIDAEHLKRVYDDLVTESGAHLLFNTVLSGVDRDEQGRVQALIVSNKLGLTALRASVYIDCTGDADLAAWAGVPFQKGDPTGDLMPATHCFVLTNVDEYAYRNTYLSGSVIHGSNPESPIYQIVESGKYPLIPDAHICNALIGPETVGFNAGHLWQVDNTDPESVSRALVAGRKLAKQIRDGLAEFCPEAFAASFLCTTAAQVGIRESRRIEGDYTLTAEDYVARRSFPDEIARNCYFIDVHHNAEDSVKNFAKRIEGTNLTGHYQPGESHGIPYRCLLPKGLQNVLVAGRSVSCERIVQGSVRVMPVCLAMGEAAGMAAAHAVKLHHGDVRAIDTARLRARLQEEGAYLPELPAA